MIASAQSVANCPSQRLLLRPREAAAALGISEKTLWTWTKAGRIPCVKLGASVRYSVKQLEEWISNELGGEVK